MYICVYIYTKCISRLLPNQSAQMEGANTEASKPKRPNARAQHAKLQNNLGSKIQNLLGPTVCLQAARLSFVENSGESYRVGLELETVFNLSDKVSVQANSAFSDNKNKNFVTSIDGELVNLGKTNISFSPEIVSSVNLSYSPKENMVLSILNKYVGEQYMSNTDSLFSKLDAYSVIDFNFNYNFKNTFFFSEIVLSGVISNLFGAEYVSNGYYYTYDDTWSDPNSITTIEGTGYYPQAARNYMLGLKFKL